MTALVIVEMLRAQVYVTNVRRKNLGLAVEAYFPECSKTKTVAVTVSAEVAPPVAAAVSRKNLPARK